MTHAELTLEHTPAPGSRLHHAQSQPAVSHEEINYALEPRVEEKFIVAVREERASHTTYNTIVIPQGTYVRLLGRNDNRRSAIVSCVSGTVVVCANADLAAAVAAMAPGATPTSNLPGAWLASGTPGAAIPVESVNQVIGVATTTGNAAVSIVEEHWDA